MSKKKKKKTVIVKGLKTIISDQNNSSSAEFPSFLLKPKQKLIYLLHDKVLLNLVLNGSPLYIYIYIYRTFNNITLNKRPVFCTLLDVSTHT